MSADEYAAIVMDEASTKIEELREENARLRHELAIMREHALRQDIEDARCALSDTMDEYADDLTGQDGEDEINAAARDYCDAQDRFIRETDPERWAELRRGA